MITTITLNAAIDRTLVVPNFQVSHRHRATEGVTLAGGRGVTIARALKELGTPVVATGLVGGLTGSNIVQRLTSEGVLNDFVRIEGASRTSTAVIDPLNENQTEINEVGPEVTPDEVQRLIDKLKYLARASTIMIFAGSLPARLEPDSFQRLLRECRKPNTDLAITSPDNVEMLRVALAQDPSLVVLEQREVEEFAGHELGDNIDAAHALDEMARSGGQTIIMATRMGCVARVRSGRVIEHIEVVGKEPSDIKTTLGSADVLAAGFVNALLTERPLKERLTNAMAVVLANMQAIGAGVFDKGEAVRQQRSVEVRDIDLSA